MSPDPSRLIAAQLRPGEDLLWAGRPDPAVTFSSGDVFLIPFSILWCGFVVFWEASAITGGAGPFFVLWGVPFIAFGVVSAVGRFPLKRRQKQRTVYGLTDQRAIIVVGDRSVRDSPLRDQPTDVRRSRDGRHASITFGAVKTGAFSNNTAYYGNTDLDFMVRGSLPFAFYDVADPEPMLDAVATAARGPR